MTDSPRDAAPHAVSTRRAVFALFGLPNAGKSTLLNAFLGENLAPVHRKPQMTRRNLTGFLTEQGCQLVFIDTPGFHEDGRPLNRELRLELERALADADAVLVILDATEPFPDAFRAALGTALKKARKALFALNKTDLPRTSWRVTPEALEQAFPGCGVVAVSARTGAGLDALKTALRNLAVPGPWLFPEDEYTTENLRGIAQSRILEKTMEFLGDEIPYELAVEIESYRETPERDTIDAKITVNRDSQKGMVIGKGGAMLKKIGSAARADLEKFLDKKVSLNIFVAVDPNWVKNPAKIRERHGFKRGGG